MTVVAYVIGPPIRAPMHIGIAKDAEARRADLAEQTVHDMRLHDFIETDDKTAVAIVTAAHEALARYNLTGEAFDVSPGQARMAFRTAYAAVQDAA